MDVNLDPGLRAPTVTPTAPGPRPAVDRQTPATDPRGANPAERGESVARLQDHVQTLHRELRFRVDEATGQTVVRVVDTDTGDLIRQMPSQDVLDLLQTEQTMQAGSGLLVREQA